MVAWDQIARNELTSQHRSYIKDARDTHEQQRSQFRKMKQDLAEVRSVSIMSPYIIIASQQLIGQENTRLKRELENQQQAAARLEEARSSRRASVSETSGLEDEIETPQVKGRVTAEERFRQLREMETKAPSRPRTAMPLGANGSADGMRLPTLASGLDESILQVI